MVFSSFAFLLVFLPLAFLGFLGARRLGRQSAVFFLLGASWLFYAFWDWRYLFLLLASMLVNYGLGVQVWRHRSRRWLVGALVFNLGLLAYYKYLGFFAGMAGLSLPGQWVLPLAISFYTFQQIAWQVDLYRGRLAAPGRLCDFMLCVSFFPHLIAGPICRPSSLLPQIERGFAIRPWHWQLGATLFVLGLAKKVLLADSLAPGVDGLFDLAQPAAPQVVLAALSYGLQLYFDFSGYADMAVGLGLMFGIRLPINFRSPYRSRSIIEFWRRWHISLSQFLRDYLYIPLGGSRHGRGRQWLSLLITMLLGGLWHGAGWQFMLWGAAHGTLLCLNHAWRWLSPWRLPGPLAWALTLVVVMLAWIPFRASDLTHALTLFTALGQWSWPSPPGLGMLLVEASALHLDRSLWLTAPLLLGVCVVAPRAFTIALRLSPVWRGLVCAILVLLVAKAMLARPDRAFLYFNF